MIKWKYISLILLVIFHGIGLYLFAEDPSNASLSWLNLLVTFGILISNEKYSLKFLIALTVIFIGGYLIEVIGTSTGILFGSYAYGTALGIKLFDVPPIIGINWIGIVIASSALAKTITDNKYLAAILAGAAATILDFIIEPVAVFYNLWQWDDGVIPIYYYICWFGFASLFSHLYISVVKRINESGIYVYVIWSIFFLMVQLKLM